MNIHHERPSADLSAIVKASMFVVLESGRELPVYHWSLDGIQWPYGDAEPPEKVNLKINFQGFYVSFPVRLQRTESPTFCQFVNLNGREREVLRVFYEGIISGRMKDSEGVIESIDAPVDLVPMHETDVERKEAQKNVRPRKMRAFFALLVYAGLAAVVFSSIGNAIWERMNWINLSNSRVVADGNFAEGDPLFFEGWLPDNRLLEVYTGMKGRVAFASDGSKVELGATVTQLVVSGRPGYQDERGFLVTLVANPDQVVAKEVDLEFGAPVKVGVNRGFSLETVTSPIKKLIDSWKPE